MASPENKPPSPLPAVVAVSGRVAAEVVSQAYKAGRPISIPSLGIEIQKDETENDETEQQKEERKG